ncbi:hypothetical protein NX784_22325 [Massilia pinisoli]|uniref:Uncharacterized protein n=1 Tax=Massilia pinisoli TaxID=1772194 RepID=A0ABT1ZWM7_9BURK|nr:hypothetical protein [Massilia pinisoli]MCS0584331.1 hypothetical protein [Massilia pinisoli]
MPVYVQHEALGKVGDVFDAHAIWQSPGLALFARRPLLRDLLERSPREHRGHAATRCFSHITLVLPQEEVDDDRHLTRGARVRDLAQGLATLHQKDFGDLLHGEDVRYQVVGADRLEPGEVEVKFGHAVYLPAPGEAVQYTVSVSRDSAVWKTVCPIYPNQRLTLIGHDEHEATYAAPGWPFGEEGAVLLINDGPDAPLEVQVRPKDAFDCSWDANAGYWTIRSRRGAVDANGAAVRLLLRVTPMRACAAQSTPARPTAPLPAAPEPSAARPVAARTTKAASAAAMASAMATTAAVPAAAAPAAAVSAGAGSPSGAAGARPAVWKPRTVPDPELTAVPLARAPAEQPAGAELDATYAPVPRQRVALVALALPRLSRYRETGAQALEIGLNRAFMPAPLARDAVIAFAIDDQDSLQAITPAGREQIAVPATFSPVDGVRLELAACAPALADRYCALLRLPQPPVLPVAAGARFTFGRAAPMLAALRVLDSPRFLKHAAGTPPSSADRLGLSRAAFSFEAGPDGWRIARQSPTQALYHLDEQLAFVAAIEDATPEQPYRLPAGHHLVAGHYVLRFDA